MATKMHAPRSSVDGKHCCLLASFSSISVPAPAGRSLRQPHLSSSYTPDAFLSLAVLDVALAGLIIIHVFATPFTKVEESFNVQVSG